MPVYVSAALVMEECAAKAERSAARAEAEGADSAAAWLRSHATEIRSAAALDARELGEAPTPTREPDLSMFVDEPEPTEPG